MFVLIYDDVCPSLHTNSRNSTSKCNVNGNNNNSCEKKLLHFFSFNRRDLVKGLDQGIGSRDWIKGLDQGIRSWDWVK